MDVHNIAHIKIMFLFNVRSNVHSWNSMIQNENFEGLVKEIMELSIMILS